MQATGTIFILIFLGLLILQIVMIVKFFQIASDVREIKRHVGVTLDEQHLIAVESYLGNTEKAKELLIKARIMTEEEFRCANWNGDSFDNSRITQLNEQLKQVGVDPNELIREIFNKQEDGVSDNLSVGSVVVEKETGKSWKIAGRNHNQLYCTMGSEEKYFQINQVVPYGEWNGK